MDAIGKLYAQMLTEATGDDINRVAKQHPDVDRETIQKYADEADPKQGRGSRYIDWLVKGHKAGKHLPEDTFRLRAGLNNFETYKNRLEKKDINQYKDISEIEDAVHPHLGVLSATAASDAKTYFGKPEHHEKIFDNGAGLQVYHTKTKEASAAIYGGGWNAGGCHSSWCTAADSDRNRFDSYSESGKNPLYQIHTPDGKVYQDEFGSDSYGGGLKDAKNNSVERSDLVKEHPDLRQVPAFQGKALEYSKPGEATDNALHSEVSKGKYKKVLAHPDVKPEHINAILDKNYLDQSVLHAALKHPQSNAESLSKLTKNPHLSDETNELIINHPSLNFEHAKEILDTDSHSNLKRALLGSDKATREMVDHVLAGDKMSSHFYLHSSPVATDEDRVKSIVAGHSPGSAIATMKDPELIRKHYKDSLNSHVSVNPNTPSDVIRSAYNSATDYNKHDLAKHKNAPADVIDTHIKNAWHPSNVNELFKFQKNITSDHVNTAFGNDHPLIKQVALRHPKAPAEIHDAAISNPSFHGSISVSPSARPMHLAQLSTSPHEFIRKNVAENKNTPKETLATLAQDPEQSVAASAAKQLAKRK